MNKESERRKQYKAGSLARYNGEPRTSNPHASDNKLWLDWDWGWTDANDETNTQDLLSKHAKQ